MLRAFAITAMLATPAIAEAPRVATDIAPIHALTAQVMRGVGTPDLIIPAAISPHDFALRPSQARLLSQADLIVAVGPLLTPWLAEAQDTLAADAVHLTLMDAPDMRLLPFREGAAFEAHDHDHGHEEEGHDDHAHADEDHADHDDHDAHKKDDGHGHADHADHGDKDHAEEGHDDEGHKEESHEDHAEHAEDGHEGHDHAGNTDPHIWLDPANGAAALTAIAEALAALDPENAQTYRANASAGQDMLTQLTADITAQLNPAKDRPFIVFHDAYHYFEARFDFEATGAISAGDADAPGAARIVELREHIAELGPVCAFAEPQMNTGVLETVLEGQGTALSVLDPLGSDLTPGADLYPALLRGIATSLADCLMP